MTRKNNRIRVLLTGGGSAGHVSPMLAVAQAIRELRPDTRFLYLGVRRGLEAVVVPREEIPIRFAPSRGMPAGRFSFAQVRFFATLAIGTLKAALTLAAFRPRVIVASGGFVSAPAVFASVLWRICTFGAWSIPVYLHEQNAVPGRMNRIAARFATCIGLSSPNGQNGFPHNRTEFVGYPVRRSVAKISRAEARRQLGLEPDDEYLVVFGGSQGARTINRALVEALPRLADRRKLKIIHAHGTMKSIEYNAAEDTRNRLENLSGTPEGYRVVEYLHDLPVHLAAADLAVIRAGAGSLLEICASGVPAIVIPKANLPGDSQVANARELAVQSAIELLFEEPALENGVLVEKVEGEKLARKILTLLDDPARRARLSENARRAYDPDAAVRIAERVLALAGEKVEMSHAPREGKETSLLYSHLPPSTLRREVEGRLGVNFEEAFNFGRLDDERLTRLDDLPYLRYRGAALLAHPAWTMRNEGIKLLGLTRHTERVDLLIHVLTDRTGAKPLHRFLGGDFYHVGFERRNAIASLVFIGSMENEVLDAVLTSLSDPYFEVRSAALKLIRLWAGPNTGKDEGDLETVVFPPEGEEHSRWTDTVESLLEDKRLEVRAEALHTLGWIGEPGRVLERCRPLLLNPHVPVREGILKAYAALIRREGAASSVGAEIHEQLEQFLITSTEVYPYFPLKELYLTLYREVGGEELT